MKNQKQSNNFKWLVLIGLIIVFIVLGFNVRKTPATPAGICSTSNYKVVTTAASTSPPTATNLQKTDPNWCGSPPGYLFSWTYSDPDNNTESRFDFQIDNNSNFSSPEVNRSFTGLSNPSPTTNSQSVVVAISVLPDNLTYNQTYYWRVKVYDSNGASSDWVSGSSFASVLHHYPEPNFSWSPVSPFAGEAVRFTDDTTYYGGSTGSAWSWTFVGADISSSVNAAPSASFQSSGTKQVTLTVTDSDGCSCSTSETVSIGFSFPKWKEIIPW